MLVDADCPGANCLCWRELNIAIRQTSANFVNFFDLSYTFLILLGHRIFIDHYPESNYEFLAVFA